MDGFITTRHLFTHSAVIVKEFGTACLFRCLWRTVTADHAVTFLECTVPLHRRAPSLSVYRFGAVIGGVDPFSLGPRAGASPGPDGPPRQGPYPWLSP